ncbi:MFS family permease [Streptomyces sp. SAI-041]|nr:MFS family permease [Streptomyces sp. SAI-041]
MRLRQYGGEQRGEPPFLRALQGLSAGGEFGGSVSVMTESAPAGRRGLYGAWQSFTVAWGLPAGAEQKAGPKEAYVLTSASASLPPSGVKKRAAMTVAKQP